MKLRYLLLPLVFSTSAWASHDTSLLTAQDAIRTNDMTQLAESEISLIGTPLAPYPRYWWFMKNIAISPDEDVRQFLHDHNNSSVAERVRIEWLKQLGKRRDWLTFDAEYAQLAPVAINAEIECYRWLSQIQNQNDATALARARASYQTGKTAAPACHDLHQQLQNSGLITQDELWQRIRLALSANNTALAGRLFQAAGAPVTPTQLTKPSTQNLATRQGRELALFFIQKTARQSPDKAAAQLEILSTSLPAADSAYVWGQLALINAKKLATADALAQFARTDQKLLSEEQWEWWARAALREQQWNTLVKIVENMPQTLAQSPTWIYWRARALKHRGRLSEAKTLLTSIEKGSAFYNILAQEELGQPLYVPNRGYTPDERALKDMRTQPSIQRALAIYQASHVLSRPEFREDAKREWRFAVRQFDDKQLITSAEIARQAHFYDMAIYSANRTRDTHDYHLRYLSPYRSIAQHYSAAVNIDESWVYGLIRQESRFVHIARSRVGASGLMQIMPATAKWIGNKIGVSSFSVNNIDTNIQFGTWYLRHVQDSLSSHPVLATAAYNAGPGRARRWQSSRPLEGAIYAETVPFNETRDYVKRVMSGAMYYAYFLDTREIRLKERLGVIPAR